MTTRNSRALCLAELMAAVALAASLAACCGGGGGSDDASAPAPAPAPTPAAPAPAPTTGDLATTVKAASYTGGSHEALAYQAVNDVRLAGGLGTVAQSTALDAEAGSQADYAAATFTTLNTVTGGPIFDSSKYMALDANGNEAAHVQPSDAQGFTGYLAANRAAHFGYPSSYVAEVAAFPMQQLTGATATTDAASCVAQIIASPAHRELLLDPSFRDVGIGFKVLAAPADGVSRFAFDCYIATAAASSSYSVTGMATAAEDWVGIYPADGSTVSALGDGHGGGYAPSVTVDSHLKLAALLFTITDAGGQVVSTTLNGDALAAGKGFDNWAFATPTAPLQPSTTYTVNFQGSAGGKAIAKVWAFTTPAQ